jgi:hypothetical protein
VRCHTSLDPNQAWWYIREPGSNPATSKLLSQNDRSMLIQPNQMQRVLARIDANGAAIAFVCLDMTAPRASKPLSNPIGAGARPVHPILCHRPEGNETRYLRAASVQGGRVVMRKTRHRGRALVEWFFVLTATAYNLIRIPKIFTATL